MSNTCLSHGLHVSVVSECKVIVMCLSEQPAMIFGCNITGNVAVLCVFLEVQHWLIAPCEKFVCVKRGLGL